MPIWPCRNDTNNHYKFPWKVKWLKSIWLFFHVKLPNWTVANVLAENPSSKVTWDTPSHSRNKLSKSTRHSLIASPHVALTAVVWRPSWPYAPFTRKGSEPTECMVPDVAQHHFIYIFSSSSLRVLFPVLASFLLFFFTEVPWFAEGMRLPHCFFPFIYILNLQPTIFLR